jgi:hypothetical protein
MVETWQYITESQGLEGVRMLVTKYLHLSVFEEGCPLSNSNQALSYQTHLALLLYSFLSLARPRKVLVF